MSVLAALRAGATASGTVGGVLCFVLLEQARVNLVVAFIAGLAFALLTRVAAVSLGTEWLVARARRHAAGQDGASQGGTQPASGSGKASGAAHDASAETTKPPVAGGTRRRGDRQARPTTRWRG
jgi:type III secretory pathway component EscV